MAAVDGIHRAGSERGVVGREAARSRTGDRLAGGHLRYRETIVDGLERAPEALASMLAGDTIGKTLVRI